MSSKIIRAPRGPNLNCKGWHQEAALRCLMNNLDPDVAERPEDLVVYGGAGKAARNCATFEGVPDEGVAFVLDLTDRKRAEDARTRAEGLDREL